MQISLTQVNQILLAVNGAIDSQGNIIEGWLGILNKPSTLKQHRGRAKLILLREWVKPHATKFSEILATRNEDNGLEIDAILSNEKVSLSCDKIAWSDLDGIEISAWEIEYLLPVLNFEA